jgi:fucose permease
MSKSATIKPNEKIDQTENDLTVPNKPKTPLKRDKLTWQMYIIGGFYGFLINALGPVMPFLRDEIGFSYLIASLHFSAFAVGIIVAGLMANLLIRRFGRGFTFWLGAGGLAVGSILLLVSKQPVFSISSIFVMGAIGALLTVTVPATLADKHPDHRSIVFTEINVIGSFSAVMAPLLIGLFARTVFGWQGGLIFMLGILFICVLIFYRTKFNEPLRRISPADQAHQKLPKIFWLYWSGIFLVAGIEFSLGFWGAEFLEKKLDLAKADAATLMSLFLVAMLVGRFTGSRIATRFSGESILIASLLVTGAGFLVHWLVGNPIISIVGLIITGLGVANLYPITLTLAIDSAHGLTNLATGRVALASGLAILIAPFLLGSLANGFGVALAYGIILILVVVALLIALITKPAK